MKSVIELLDLSTWKKQKEIISELHRDYGINISSREWRNAVTNWNKKWAEGEVDYCITHSNVNGFKATTNVEEAQIGINDFRSRRNKMYQREKDILEGFKRKNMYQFDFEKGELR
ncbi:MAG: hypothetical protein KH135_04730 [Firmicutes bacterium]|nr:hypothetical protein [Bacillota bacterium]